MRLGNEVRKRTGNGTWKSIGDDSRKGIAGLLMALESCNSRAEQLARHVLAYGRPQTVEELVGRIEAVSVESAQNAARALLSRSRPAVVALGSGRGLDSAVTFAEGLTASKARARLH